jgi:hypothetical protein
MTMVLLDADVAKAFPDSSSVNRRFDDSPKTLKSSSLDVPETVPTLRHKRRDSVRIDERTEGDLSC